MHGAPAYGRYPTGCPWKQAPEGTSGRPRQLKRPSTGCGPDFFGGLGGQMAKGQPKRLNGTQRRRAPNVTHSAVWETRVRKTIQINVYFAHQAKTQKLVPKRRAPNVTHSAVSWTSAALSASSRNKSAACFATSPKRRRATTT